MDAIERLRKRAQNEATCIELSRQNKALRNRVARLEEALKELLDYTRSCEGMLNATESGVCAKARRALEEK